MAKIKNTDNTSEIEASEAQQPAQETNSSLDGSSSTEMGNITESQATIHQQSENLSAKQMSKKSDKESPDSFTLEILKAYSNYESLYVDKFGCAYTPDTSEPIRGSAVLYKNPHFKPE